MPNLDLNKAAFFQKKLPYIQGAVTLLAHLRFNILIFCNALHL